MLLFPGRGKKRNRTLRGRDHHPVPDGHSCVIVIDDDNDFIEFVIDIDASLSD